MLRHLYLWMMVIGVLVILLGLADETTSAQDLQQPDPHCIACVQPDCNPCELLQDGKCRPIFGCTP